MKSVSKARIAPRKNPAIPERMQPGINQERGEDEAQSVALSVPGKNLSGATLPSFAQTP
jgi:hypothetical protein